MAARDEAQAHTELDAAADLIRTGLAANAADLQALAGNPAQAAVVAVLRRVLSREAQLYTTLRALGRWTD